MGAPAYGAHQLFTLEHRVFRYLALDPTYLLDLRTAPAPARQWLRHTRPTRDIGPPGDPYRLYSLARGHDLLIHLHVISAAHPL